MTVTCGFSKHSNISSPVFFSLKVYLYKCFSKMLLKMQKETTQYYCHYTRISFTLLNKYHGFFPLRDGYHHSIKFLLFLKKLISITFLFKKLLRKGFLCELHFLFFSKKKIVQSKNFFCSVSISWIKFLFWCFFFVSISSHTNTLPQVADGNANEISKKMEKTKIDESSKGEEKEKGGQRPTMRNKSMKKKKMTDDEIMDALS